MLIGAWLPSDSVPVLVGSVITGAAWLLIVGWLVKEIIRWRAT